MSWRGATVLDGSCLQKFDRALASVQHKHGKAAHEIQRAMPVVSDLVAAFSDNVCVRACGASTCPSCCRSSLKIKEPLRLPPYWELAARAGSHTAGTGGLMSFDASGRMKLDAELDHP